MLVREASDETDGWFDWSGTDGKADGAQSAEGGIPASGVESHGGASGRTGERGREARGESAGGRGGRGHADQHRERSARAGGSRVGRARRAGWIAARQHLHGFEHDFSGAGAACGRRVRRAWRGFSGRAGNRRRLGSEKRRAGIHDWRKSGRAGAREACAGSAREEIFPAGARMARGRP